METDHSREQVREEALCIAQEGALGLHAPELLQEGEDYDLRIREPLYGLVASCVRVDPGVGVVGEAEQHGQGLFQGGERRGMLGVGNPGLLWSGSGRMVLFLLSIHATLI